MPAVYVATEGLTDTAVVRRICRELEIDILAVYGEKGKDQVSRSLHGYNESARRWPWLVLRDLNADADCAPRLRQRLLPDPAPHRVFRLAVRELESWLLADRDAFGQFFSVHVQRIPEEPESIPDPKRGLVDVVRRSRSRHMRDDIVPREGSGRSVGPGYLGRITDFVQTAWSPTTASLRSDSLRRCMERLSLVQDP